MWVVIKDVDGIKVSHARLVLVGQQGITISDMHVDAALKTARTATVLAGFYIR